jgi:hypothetical protein
MYIGIQRRILSFTFIFFCGKAIPSGKAGDNERFALVTSRLGRNFFLRADGDNFVSFHFKPATQNFFVLRRIQYFYLTAVDSFFTY